MRRRSFLAFASSAVLAMVLSVSVLLAGCTFAQSVDEAANILDATLPVVQGIGGVVSLADPALAPVVIAFVTAYSTEEPVATKAFRDWVTADAANQPGALGIFEAALTTLKTDLAQLETAAHVKDPAHQNTIDLFVASAQSMLTEVLTLVLQVKAAGGTSSAALLVLHENYGGGADASPAKTKKAALPKPAVDHKHFSADLKKRLAVKTGDPKLDAVRAEVASKLKQ